MENTATMARKTTNGQLPAATPRPYLTPELVEIPRGVARQLQSMAIAAHFDQIRDGLITRLANTKDMPELETAMEDFLDTQKFLNEDFTEQPEPQPEYLQ